MLDRIYCLKIDSSGTNPIDNSYAGFDDQYFSDVSFGEQYTLRKRCRRLVLSTELYLNKESSSKQGRVISMKYNKVIKPLIVEQVWEALPEYKVLKSQADLMYYDDLNVSVER